VRLAGWSPVVSSRFGNRFAYGHVVEDGRHLIFSGGLGCSGMPVRIGVPPETVLVELGAQSLQEATGRVMPHREACLQKVTTLGA
jgi:predicted MPP superfamily phosphohydrolase